MLVNHSSPVCDHFMNETALVSDLFVSSNNALNGGVMSQFIQFGGQVVMVGTRFPLYLQILRKCMYRGIWLFICLTP